MPKKANPRNLTRTMMPTSNQHGILTIDIPVNELTCRLAPIDGCWMLDEGKAQQYLQTLSRVDIVEAHKHQLAVDAAADPKAGLFDAPSGGDKKPYQIVNGVAKIGMTGPMTKRPSSMSFLFGGASTIYTRNMIRTAINDPDVTAIGMIIDSPGGQVAGTADLADDIYTFGKIKPIGTYFSDTGCSAAYWAGSQGSIVWANSTAIIGSIGAYMVIQDLSKMADELGIKVHVIKSAEFKGAGEPGTEVTDEQLANFKRTIMSLHKEFVKGIARGRGSAIEDVDALADGRVHVGKEAQKLGLVDKIGSEDQFIDHLSKIDGKPSTSRVGATGDKSGSSNMPDEPNATEASAEEKQSLWARLGAVLGIGGEAAAAGTSNQPAASTSELDPAVKARIANLEKRNITALGEQFVTKAISDQKILPAQADGLRDLYMQCAMDDLADDSGDGKRINALEAYVEGSPKIGLLGEHIEGTLKAKGAVVLADIATSDVSAMDEAAAANARAWAEKMNGNGKAKVAS
jgi:signal peptide peptidase SppA